MPRTNIIFILCFLVTNVSGQSGNLFITNYTPESYSSKDYPVSPVNYQMVQDARGVLYVSNINLILEFDGNHWNKVLNSQLVSPALLSINQQGKIFVATYTKPELGFLSTDLRGRVEYHSLSEKIHAKNFITRKIFCIGNAAYFVSTDTILKWTGSEFEVIHSPGIINKTFIVNDRPYFLMANNSLFTLQNNSLIEETTASLALIGRPDLLISAAPSEKVPDQSLAFVAGGKIFRFESAHWLEIQTSLTPLLQRLYESGGKIRSGRRLRNGNIALATSDQGIMICDQAGNLVQQITRSNSSIIDNQIWSVYEDNSNGLWALCETGMSRIEYPPVLTYLDYTNNLNGSRVDCLLKFKGALYACTPAGLYKAELSNERIIFNRVGPQSGTWEIIAAGNRLLLASNAGIFEVQNDRLFQICEGITYSLLVSGNFDNVLFAGTDNGLEVLKFQNQKWTLMGTVEGINHRVFTMAETQDQKLWIAYDKVSLVDFSKGISLHPGVENFDEGQGFLNDVNGWFEVYNVNGKIYFGSWKGLFHFEEKSRHLEHDSSLGKMFAQGRECVELTGDTDGNIWLTSLFVTGKIIKSNGLVSWDTTAFMRLPPSNAVRDIMIDEDSRVWLGTDLGIYSYNPVAENTSASSFNTLIRKFTVNRDSTVFFGTFTDSLGNFSRNQSNQFNLRIPFKERSVSFSFSSSDYTAPSRVQYATYLKGNEKSWSNWSDQTEKNYSNLHEGTYTFYVKAKNIDGSVSDPVLFTFSILSPWYRAWWAYIIYGTAAVLFIFLILWLNQRRLILAKRNLERTVKARTKELEEKTAQLENTMVELKNTETQLIHSEKMASLGQLTAGIAHEINNPINFVAGNVEPLQRDIRDLREMILKYHSIIEEKNLVSQFEEINYSKSKMDFEVTADEVEKLLRGIKEGSNRTAEIVRGLRNFSRTDESEIKSMNLNESIDSTLTLLQNKYKNRIEIIKEYDALLPPIECYPGQLNQVFMNILSNAIDAIQGEGKISITTSRQDQNVKISVSDTGIGIEKGVINKIFDPFFTTKPVGKGTGLGLAISYGIIEKHQGKISVKSEPQKGATFTIILPIKQLQ